MICLTKGQCLTVCLVLFLAAGSCFAAAAPVSGTVSERIDSFFVGLKTNFDKIAQAPAMKKAARPAVDKLFWSALKSHQPYLSLVRTDAKGAVVNEKVRLENPQPNPKAEKESVTDQPWFKSVSAGQQEYVDHIKDEERGRYYLVWASPIMVKGAKGKETFGGAVALKIDIWDCFHLFGKKETTPFLVRMEQKSLYSDKWQGDVGYVEDKLNIPGIENISVRCPREAADASVATDSLLRENARQKAQLDSARNKAIEDSVRAAKAAKATQQKKAVQRKIAAAVALVALLIFTVLLFQLIRGFREKAVLRKIDRQSGQKKL
jgi:hypothetical protein